MTRDLGAMHVFHGPNDYPTYACHFNREHSGHPRFGRATGATIAIAHWESDRAG